MVSTADTVSGKNRRASLDELIPSSPYGGKGVGKSGGKGKDQSEEPMGKGTVLDKGKGKGKVKGSKGGAMDGSDNYPREPHYGREGNTDKGGDGGGGKGSSEEASEEEKETLPPAAAAWASVRPTATTSKWMHVLTRVKSAQAKCEAALEILDELEKQLVEM